VNTRCRLCSKVRSIIDTHVAALAARPVCALPPPGHVLLRETL
jgi:hypothetical protein